jgi:predicted nucleic acid-binding protein
MRLRIRQTRLGSKILGGDVAETVRLRPEGAGVFDLQIVATMLANGVQHVYTFNPWDFRVFAELTVVTPT